MMFELFTALRLVDMSSTEIFCIVLVSRMLTVRPSELRLQSKPYASGRSVQPVNANRGVTSTRAE
jgi:hypothetical protein